MKKNNLWIKPPSIFERYLETEKLMVYYESLNDPKMEEEYRSKAIELWYLLNENEIKVLNMRTEEEIKDILNEK